MNAFEGATDEAGSGPPAPAKIFSFRTTSWGLVARASNHDSPVVDEALGTLCATYWYPVYAYVRRRWGKGCHDAEDLTQEFFARLLEKGWLKTADPSRGRFRTFLLAAVESMLKNEAARAGAIKRGGGVAPVSFDALAADEWYQNEPAELPPQHLYDRAWASAIHQKVQARLRKEFTAGSSQTARVYPKVERRLLNGQLSVFYPEWSQELGIPPGSIAVAVNRIRARLASALREEVAQTLTSPSEEEVSTELRALKAAWSESPPTA